MIDNDWLLGLRIARFVLIGALAVLALAAGVAVVGAFA